MDYGYFLRDFFFTNSGLSGLTTLTMRLCIQHDGHEAMHCMSSLAVAETYIEIMDSISHF